MKPKHAIWGLIVVLLVVHQDNFLWDNATLVFGFMPVGLLYHACISVAASVVWLLATRFAWPSELEKSAAKAGAPTRLKQDSSNQDSAAP